MKMAFRRYGMLGTALVVLFFVGTASYNSGYRDGMSSYSMVASVTPAPTPDPHALFTHDNVLIRLNEARLAVGLPMLGDDPYLDDQAQGDLKDNCPISDTNPHTNFSYKNRAGAFKGYYQAGEDLASSGSWTPQQAISGLLTSPTHAAMINNAEWNVVGIGVSTDPVDCVSLIFGKTF